MSESVIDRLWANGGKLATDAAREIEALQERARELTFALVLAMANLDGDAAKEVASVIEKHGVKAE